MGTNLVDKLKNIRPFTESTLLALHELPELDSYDTFVDTFLQQCALVEQSCAFYAELSNYRKWKHQLEKTKSSLADALDSIDEDKVWSFVSKTITQSRRCNDGRTVDGQHIYSQAVLATDELKKMDNRFLDLKESLLNDYCQHMFMAQYGERQLQVRLGQLLDLDPSTPEHREHLKSFISALFAHIRMDEPDSQFTASCRQWLAQLGSTLLLHNPDFDDRLFMASHVLRCQGGISSWAAGYVQAPNPLRANNFGEGVQCLNQSLAILHAILSPIKHREKLLGITESQHKSAGDSVGSDEVWLLVDAETEESEEVEANKLYFTETDIISLLAQVPFHSIIKFILEGGKCFEDEDSAVHEYEYQVKYGEMNEVTMLKLLAVSTRLVQILKQGLNTFNCMRFRRLTDQITLMIKKTVQSVSKFWLSCSNHFKSDDQAIKLRLQVEYDHFILRAVTTILESQRSGVWKFISVVPYEGVTASMMWHILWVSYNNGRDELDELGGLCPYFSDSYWQTKFDEPAVKYLFHEKLSKLSPLEGNYLLESLGNMAKSRSIEESDFITTIATEMLEMSYFKDHDNADITHKCSEMFAEIASIHPFFISTIIVKLKDLLETNEAVIDCFKQIPLQLWQPDEDTMPILIDWLHNQSIGSFYNRLSRVILSKLNWDVDSAGTRLYLDSQTHRLMAREIMKAANQHVIIEDSEDPFNLPLFSAETDENSLLQLAVNVQPRGFIEWCWRLLLLLKLHLLDQPNASSKHLSIAASQQYTEIDDFAPPPNMESDCDYYQITKGMARQNPFAIYIYLSLSDQGHDTEAIAKNISLLTRLMDKNFVPSVSLLAHFIPFNLASSRAILSDSKFVSALHALVDVIGPKELTGVILYQLDAFEAERQEILSLWINLLYSVTCIVLKQWSSSSWFMANARGLQQIVYLLDNLIEATYKDDKLHNLLLSFFIQRPQDELFAKQIASSGLFSWLPWVSNQKCQWITPLHILQQKFSKSIWLSWLLIKIDQLKMEKVWDELIVKLNLNLELTVDQAIKECCADQKCDPIPTAILPINAWLKLIIETPEDHPLMPVLCYNFFLCYFSSPANNGSVGNRFLTTATTRSLKAKFYSMSDYHYKLYSEGAQSTKKFHSQNHKLFRAFSVYLENGHLHDPFVDVNHLPPEYYTEILKTLIGQSASETIAKPFVDQESIRADELRHMGFWLQLKKLCRTLPTNEATAPPPKPVRAATDLKDAPVACPKAQAINREAHLSSQTSVGHDISVISSMLQHNIRLILDEASYFENRIAKLEELNKNYVTLLRQLYENKPKDLILKVSCDRDNYDPSGCTGAAQLNFQFDEATRNEQASKERDRNRSDFNRIYLELLDIPSNKTVITAAHMEAFLRLLAESTNEENRKAQNDIRDYFLSAIDKSYVNYPPTRHLFTFLMELLSFDTIELRDRNSFFLLQAALNYPLLIEYFAPRLIPSQCSVDCFLAMYKHIQERLLNCPPQIIFVLLSKFDVGHWLKLASDESTQQFMQVLFSALMSFGQRPLDDQMLVLGLYRKHLQYLVLSHFPHNLKPVTEMLMQGMCSFKLCPSLWNDLLLSFGLFIKPNLEFQQVIAEIRKYANAQPLFTNRDLYILLQAMASEIEQIKEKQSRLEIVEYLKEYSKSYSNVLITVSFMWINVNSKNLEGNLDNMWRPLIKCWYHWIFPTMLSDFIAKRDLDIMWDSFIATMKYLQECFYAMSSGILSLAWHQFAQYVHRAQINDAAHYELIQQKLSLLTWNRFVPTDADIEPMFNAIFVEFPPYKLLAHIFRAVNWVHASHYIQSDKVEASLERLAVTIIEVGAIERKLPIKEIPFQILPAEKATSICSRICQNFDFGRYVQAGLDSPEADYLDLLKILGTYVHTDLNSAELIQDYLAKQSIYVATISQILSTAVRNDPLLISNKERPCSKLIKATVEHLNLTVSHAAQSSSQRIELLALLLNFIDSVNDDQSRTELLEPLLAHVVGLRNPFVIKDLIVCACHTLSSAQLLAVTVEQLLTAYIPAEGTLIDIADCHRFGPVAMEDYLRACVQANGGLSLFVLHFNAKADGCSQSRLKLTAEICDSSSQLRPNNNGSASSEVKILLLWYNLLVDLITLLSSDESTQPLIKTTLRMAHQLIKVVDEGATSGFLSFVKITVSRRQLSCRTALLLTIMASLAVKRLSEVVGYQAEHPMALEVTALSKNIYGRLQNCRKNKSYVDWVPLIDQVLEHLSSEDSLALEGTTFLRTYLIDIADVNLCNFMLMLDSN